MSCSKDIQHLGNIVEALITVFEDTMTVIRRAVRRSGEIVGRLQKVPGERINVINARQMMAKRLKPDA